MGVGQGWATDCLAQPKVSQGARGGSQVPCPSQEWDASGRILCAAQAQVLSEELNLRCFSRRADCFLCHLPWGPWCPLCHFTPVHPILCPATWPPAPALVVSNPQQPTFSIWMTTWYGACWEESVTTRCRLLTAPGCPPRGPETLCWSHHGCVHAEKGPTFFQFTPRLSPG